MALDYMAGQSRGSFSAITDRDLELAGFDPERTRNFAVRLAAQYRAAQTRSDLEQAEAKLTGYARGSEIATAWLRQQIAR